MSTSTKSLRYFTVANSEGVDREYDCFEVLKWFLDEDVVNNFNTLCTVENLGESAMSKLEVIIATEPLHELVEQFNSYDFDLVLSSLLSK